MQALVFTAAGMVEMREVAEPQAQPGETIIDVRACGVCGSDLYGFKKATVYRSPLIMGHEFAGLTANGERVVVNPVVNCGHCDLCLRGRPELCRSSYVIGVHKNGAFTERVAVPESQLRPLPDTLEWSHAAMIEPLANAVHVWSLLPEPPQRIAVIGAGAIGLSVMLIAKVHGVTPDALERSADRAQVASAIGARSVASLDGEYDVIVDAVGLSATRRLAVEHLRPGGTAIWIGLAEPEVTINGNLGVVREVTIRGSFAFTPTEFDQAIGLAQEVDLSWTRTFPLKDAESVFMSMANGRTDVSKAIFSVGSG